MEQYNVLYSSKNTPVSEPIPGRKDQVQNNTGGYVFQLDKWSRLNRFLILGSAQNTYYQSARDLTKENAAGVLDCIAEDAKRVVDTLVEISDKGRAPKNDPALFVLALVVAHADKDGRKYALANLPKVARIGTHILNFCAYLDSQSGWGRMKREGVAAWYTGQDLDRLAYQLVKYQSRNGWSQRDVLRLTHPKATDDAMNNLFRYVRHGFDEVKYKAEDELKTRPGAVRENLPAIVQAFEQAKTADKKTVINLITEHGLSMEMVPTEFHKDPDVWLALLQHAGITNIIRNLGRLSSIGLLTPMSKTSKDIRDKILDVNLLKKGRVHPISVLYALKTYASGRGARGSLSWNPVPQIVDALDEAFYLAFETFEPAGKNTLLGIDVSGSMGGFWGHASGGIQAIGLSPRELAAAMAMVTIRKEPAYYALGFCHEFVDLGLSPKMRLDEVVRKTANLPFGSTRVALPMEWALKNKVEVDTFHVYTDNEVNTGGHPIQALKRYRQKMGRDARLIVAGFTSTGFTVADPNDRGCLDVVGFDTAAPAVMAEFSRGNL